MLTDLLVGDAGVLPPFEASVEILRTPRQDPGSRVSVDGLEPGHVVLVKLDPHLSLDEDGLQALERLGGGGIDAERPPQQPSCGLNSPLTKGGTPGLDEHRRGLLGTLRGGATRLLVEDPEGTQRVVVVRIELDRVLQMSSGAGHILAERELQPSGAHMEARQQDRIVPARDERAFEGVKAALK